MAELALNSKDKFTASFYGKSGKKYVPQNAEQAGKIIADVKNEEFVVSSVKKHEKKRHPAPPFITSTLQQEASRKLGFTVKRTMMAAQQLYEGVEVKGHGTVGLITYMRTDSLRIANEALSSVRDFIKGSFGDENLPSSPRVYKTKGNAQDAHEAIRPSYVTITPQEAKESLSGDMYKLYKLIWERFVASQMESAVYDTISADITAGKYMFKANGSKIKFKGFMALYVESRDDGNEEKDTRLPNIKDGDKLKLIELKDEQHFTQPPQRYTEATLIKALEEMGIGRPSTYAPTITTITARGYVGREKKQLYPTELGKVVNDIMENYFEMIADVKFTANMEEKLDGVEDGTTEWIDIMKSFYAPFEDVLLRAEEEISKIKVKDEVSDVICEKCGRNMVYKMGKFGKFLACPGFPECRNTKAIVVETGAFCPKCGGKILEKKSARGKIYYGCEKNPECDFMSWDAPVKDEKCPDCGGLLLAEKGKNAKIVCANEKCGFEKAITKKKK